MSGYGQFEEVDMFGQQSHEDIVAAIAVEFQTRKRDQQSLLTQSQPMAASAIPDHVTSPLLHDPPPITTKQLPPPARMSMSSSSKGGRGGGGGDGIPCASNLRPKWALMNVDDVLGHKIKIIPDSPDGVYVAFLPTNATPEPECCACHEQIEHCVVMRVTPGFQHCQFIFKWTVSPIDSKYATFSTTKQRPSVFSASTYEKYIGWIGFELLIDKLDVRKVFKWCCDRRGLKFNTCGYYCLPCNVLCLPSCCAYNAGGTQYFCAEEVSSALKACEIDGFTDTVPHSCTPDILFNMLVEQAKIGTAYRIDGIRFRVKEDTCGSGGLIGRSKTSASTGSARKDN